MRKTKKKMKKKEEGKSTHDIIMKRDEMETGQAAILFPRSGAFAYGGSMRIRFPRSDSPNRMRERCIRGK